MSGIQGIGILKQRFPDLPIIALTVYDDDEIFGVLCAGALGYLLKNTLSGRWLEALKEAINGWSEVLSHYQPARFRAILGLNKLKGVNRFLFPQVLCLLLKQELLTAFIFVFVSAIAFEISNSSHSDINWHT